MKLTYRDKIIAAVILAIAKAVDRHRRRDDDDDDREE